MHVGVMITSKKRSCGGRRDAGEGASYTVGTELGSTRHGTTRGAQRGRRDQSWVGDSGVNEVVRVGETRGHVTRETPSSLMLHGGSF